MEDVLVKEVDCVLCKATYSPIVEPDEDETYYDIHCSSCVKWVRVTTGDSVRATLREVLSLKGEALALAIETMLATCPCGSEFRHDAGNRCPECIIKIKSATKRADNPASANFHCIWNIEKLKELEPKVFGFIFQKLATKEDTLAEFIRKYDKGEIDAEEYMEGIENLQFRESRQLSVIKVWAMILGPDMAFNAAADHNLVDKYGTRILITLAAGLEMGYGKPMLTTLSNLEKELDGAEQKEIQMFIKKIAGGF